MLTLCLVLVQKKKKIPLFLLSFQMLHSFIHWILFLVPSDMFPLSALISWPSWPLSLPPSPLAIASLQESLLRLILSLRFCACFLCPDYIFSTKLHSLVSYYLWSLNVSSENCKHTYIPIAISLTFTGLLLSKTLTIICSTIYLNYLLIFNVQ